MSDHPMMDDDLAQAYARAHALRDDDAGPAASVRANVLAAAQAVAAAQAPAPTPSLTPVAGPVADVGSERGDAPNLSSWRVRSGAAFGALLIEAQLEWESIAAAEWDEEKIRKRWARLAESRRVADKKALPHGLPPKPKLEKLAKATATAYFQSLYPEEA